MSTPILRTKIYIPQPRADLIPRPQLTAHLEAGLSGKLTVISAPAGFGKTTLLSEWIHQKTTAGSKLGDGKSRLSSVAWLSLDEADNDLVRFLAYLIAALRTIPEFEAVNIGESLLGKSQSPGVGKEESQSITTLLTELINEITIHRPAAFILVLDDYHLITTEKIHDALAFLVENLPPNMHLVIAARADLPIHVARLRGSGLMNELRLAELRFTTTEAAAFLNQVMNLNLETDDIRALHRRTEGWIAGLQMASLALRAKTTTQGSENIHQFIQDFTGSNRYVLDYLVEEVLQEQSDQVQSFLLKTSILNRLSASLCDALSVESQDDMIPLTQPQAALINSQEVLEYLDHANLFLIPMDDQREWYRYHRLFADLLRQRLRQEYPKLGGILHHRASEWYECHGFIEPAIDHALAGDDFERAAVLIDENIESSLMRGEIPTALRWLEALPEDLVFAKQRLCLYYAWTLMLTGRSLGEIETQLAKIRANDDFTSGGVASLRGFLAIFQLRLENAVSHAQQALALLPQGATFMRGIAEWIISYVSLMDDDPHSRNVMLNELLQVSQELGNTMIAIWTLAQIARLHIHAAELREAEQIYQRALALASDDQGKLLPIAGAAQIGLAKIYFEWNQLDTALTYLKVGIDNSLRWREIAAMDGYLTLSRLRQTRGDFDEAQAALDQAAMIALKFDAADWDDQYVAMYQARLLVSQGKLQAAILALQDQEKEIEALPGDGAGFESKYSKTMLDHLQITLANALILQGNPDQALSLLEPVLRNMVERQRIDYTIEIQTLQAMAYQIRGDIPNAIARLENALGLAEPGGYLRIFLDRGEALFSILSQIDPNVPVGPYAARIMREFERASGDQQVASQDERKPTLVKQPEATLMDPLSERELEVLWLLQTNLSTPEIADELVIAVSTVRTHIKNIYSKLGVHSRTEAVDRAKDLDFI
jgi:LuxR family maltose regulon positive regulatory protein